MIITWTIDTDKSIGRINPEIYGGFVEHLGRNIYGGIYDTFSSAADENGFRRDVLKLIRELNMPVTRYPGGCFTDLWKWEDSVGPKSQRKAALDPAWRQLETYEFGLDEFMKWAAIANTKPLLTVNCANRFLSDTAALYEYCNFPGGTYWSDQRRRNGIEKPYGIHTWFMGNELYGQWEFGMMNAQEYGRIAREHAKLLKEFDPECRIIVCGNPHDMQWNETVLNICGKYADLISLHEMFYEKDKTLNEYLRSVDQFEQSIAETIRLCRKMPHSVRISVDEWIIWDFDRRMHPEEKWTTGMHLLEQDYTMKEALIAGALFSCFHRHADWIELACIAQSVNVIAPIRTEPNGTAWKQSIFYPFMFASKYGQGTVLAITENGNDNDDLKGSAIWTDDNQLVLFLINRSDRDFDFQCHVAFAPILIEARTLHHNDLNITNSAEAEVLTPEVLDRAETRENAVFAMLSPYSWNMIILGYL
ncbi:MAG: hypothetical protein LBM70_04900 [Victivallales bacterium]|jgi:alpha-N-arabinofuranosidase|nr:hypothetical protein [Victivallales bacterium]